MEYIRIAVVYFVLITSACYDFTLYPRDSGASGVGGDSSSAISGQSGTDVQLDGSPKQGETSFQRSTDKDTAGTGRGGTSGAMVTDSSGEGKQSPSAGTATGSGGNGGEVSAGGNQTATAGSATSSGGSGGVISSADAGNTTSPGGGCEVSSIPDDIRTNYNIDPFYQKYASANEIVIATSSNVGDEAIIRDCRLLLDLYGKRDDARKSIISQKVFFTLIAQSEQLSSLPEIGSKYGNQYDARALLAEHDADYLLGRWYHVYGGRSLGRRLPLPARVWTYIIGFSPR